MRIARVIAIVAVVLMVAGLVVGTGCGAQGPKGDTGATGGVCSLFVNPIVYSGTTPAIYGAGFVSGASVYLELNCRMHTGADYNWSTTTTVNEWGAFMVNLPVPTGIDANVYTVKASVNGVHVANAAVWIH